MIYRFGNFECDEARHELRQAGQGVAIEPKVFQVLRYFLDHPDRVVTKDELLEQCWPDAFVSEAALTRCLTKLRKIVHSEPTAPPVIKTVPRHGYRFVAELTTLAHEQASDTIATPLLPDTPSLQEPVSTTPSAPLETATVPVSDRNALGNRCAP